MRFPPCRTEPAVILAGLCEQGVTPNAQAKLDVSALIAKDGQRQQQPKQQDHDDQHDDISFHGDALTEQEIQRRS
jgi:hypothetical protein